MKYFFLFYLFFFQIVSAKTIEVGLITENLNISNTIQISESYDFPESFQLNESDEIHHRYTATPVWFKFQLHNTLDRTNDFYIYSNAGLLGNLTLYKFENSLNEYIEVAKDAINERQVPGGVHPKFKLHLEPNETAIYIIKRESIHHLDTKFILGDIDSVNESEYALEKLYIIYIAAFLMIFFYNLSVFSFTRDRDFLYYCLFIASISITVLILNGYLERNYFSFEINEHLGAFSSLSLVVSVIFAYSFLNFKSVYPNIKKILAPSVGFGVFTLVSNFTPLYKVFPNFFGTIIDFNIVLTICLIMYLSIRKAIKYKDPLAKIYVLSWFFMYGSVIIWFGVYAQIIPFNFFTQNIIIFGNIIEMLILSVALAYKMNILTTEKNFANQQARNKEKLQKIVRVLSHDIANSIFIILTYTRQKERGVSHFDNDRAWERVKRAAKNIENILNSVKEEQKLERELEFIQKSKINIIKSLNSALSNFEEKATEKNISFIKDFLEEEILLESNDTILTHQIFGNLISNAIKYSHSNSDINITISKKMNQTIIVIRDYGIGITSGLIEKIEAEKSTHSTIGTHGEQGTGFGLYLVISYAKALGIKLTIKRATSGLGTEAILIF